MRCRGGAMVPALALLAATVAALAALAVGQRSVLTAARNRMEAERARVAAYSGLQRAMAALESVEPGLVTLDDEWNAFGMGEESYVLNGSSFRIQIVDNCSRIDINTVAQEQLEMMELTTEQIDSLLDWREPELVPRPEGGKDEFYNGLAVPYNTKLAAFDTVDELLLVKGFDGPTLYQPLGWAVGEGVVYSTGEAVPPLYDLLTADSYSPNLGPDGEAKLNVNNVDASAMVQRGVPNNIADAIIERRNQQGTFNSMSEVLSVQGVNLENAGTLMDFLTVSANAEIQGKINVNTAPTSVLETIPGLEADIALTIANQAGYDSYTDLATISGMDLEALGALANMTTMGSNSFTVRVIGTAGRAQHALEAVVRYRNNRWVVQKVFRPPYGDMASRWQWFEQVSNEVDMRVDR